jgi:pimeloyl-ACP methyl ester carboxylesterase
MQSRTIQTDGLRQQILEAGSGPLVLLIHGFPELGISWRAQVQALAEAGPLRDCLRHWLDSLESHTQAAVLQEVA